MLLVHGAGGGVGLAAVEMGKMLGATVIAAASAEEKLAIARSEGADHLVLLRDASRSATPSSASPTAAARTWCSIPSAARCSKTACAASTGARGCWSSVSPAALGSPKPICLMIKGASVLGVRAGEAVRRNPALGEVAIEGAAGVGGGRQNPRPTFRTGCRWKIMRKAMRLLIDRKAIGRVALMMR